MDLGAERLLGLSFCPHLADQMSPSPMLHCDFHRTPEAGRVEGLMGFIGA